MGWGGAGKSWGTQQSFGGKGWGGGGGKGPRGNKEAKVWVGGVPETVTVEELKQNFEQAGTVVFSKKLSGGTALIEFSTPDEAKKAVTLFNGAQVGDGTLEVDSWTAKDAGASG